MDKMNKRMAAKVREAGRRACREYCKELPPPTRWPCLLLPCWKCPHLKGGKDCQGNPIGTRDAVIAAARAAVIELPNQDKQEASRGGVGSRKE